MKIWNTIKLIGFLLPVTTVFSDQIGNFSVVKGSSMYPILNQEESQNDRVWVNHFIGKYGELNHGEVVTLNSPIESKNKVLIKRLIALENDEVRYLDARGNKKGPITIPRGHVWVQGENISSLDSRTFGPIPINMINGVVRWVLWPKPRKLRTKLPKGVRINIHHTNSKIKK